MFCQWCGSPWDVVKIQMLTSGDDPMYETICERCLELNDVEDSRR